MCKNIETARFQCFRVFGAPDAYEPDYNGDGHFYHGPTGLRWGVHPEDDGGVGVLEIAPNAKPICVLYDELLEKEKLNPPAPKTQRPPHIQRLKSRNRNNQVKFGDRYEIDYMGNSYFERGDLGKRIREMAELHGTGECVIGGYKIKFVYDPRNYNEAGAEETINQIFNGKQDWWIEEDPYFDERSVKANVRELAKRDTWMKMSAGKQHSHSPQGIYGVPRPVYAYDAWFDIRFGLFWTIDHKANIADFILNFKKTVEYNNAKAAEKRSQSNA